MVRGVAGRGRKGQALIGPVLPPPRPPVVVAADVQIASIALRVGARTSGIVVQDVGRRATRRSVPLGPRTVTIPLTPGLHVMRVKAVGPGGAVWSTTRRVWVLPLSARTIGALPGRVDRVLQRDLDRRVSVFPAVVGIYVQHLGSGCGAAVNAGAQFPAASTLKAGILVHAVRRGGVDARLLDDMIIRSSDTAANRVIALTGGPTAVTNTLRDLHLAQSLVRRPYIIEMERRRHARIPVLATRRPALYTNFIATPFELATLFSAVHRGMLGRGGVNRIGVNQARVRRDIARRFLDVADRTKLVAGVPNTIPIAHKTGYTTTTKHDVGVLYLPSGPVVIAVMTWSASGVSDGRGDALIASIARTARTRLARGGRC